MLNAQQVVHFLIIFYLIGVIVSFLHLYVWENNRIINILSGFFNLVGFKSYGWFIAGMLSYLYVKYNKNIYFWWYAIAFSLIGLSDIEINGERNIWGILIYGGLLILIFFLCLRYKSFQDKIASSKVLAFMGFISYPFYLIHENAVLYLTKGINDRLQIDSNLGFLLPIIPIFIVIIISYIIAKYIEPSLRKILTQGFNLLETSKS